MHTILFPVSASKFKLRPAAFYAAIALLLWFALDAQRATASPLQIRQLTISEVTDSSAVISWRTDVPAVSRIYFGLDSTLKRFTPPTTDPDTVHQFILNGLWPNHLYRFRAESVSPDSAETAIADSSFITAAGLSVVFENVQGIFDRNCVRCHQGTNAPVGLSLKSEVSYDNIVNVPGAEMPTLMRIDPGHRERSWLYIKISTDNPPAGARMENLPPEEIDLIGRWIDQGALRQPPPPYMPLQLRVNALPEGEINIAYAQTLEVWGGLPPYSFSVASGALPPGLALDPQSGMIAGVPSVDGTYNFTLRITDRQSPSAALEQNFRIVIRNTQNKWSVPDGFIIQPVVTDLHLPVNVAFIPNAGPRPDDPFFYVTLLYGQIVTVLRNFDTIVYADNLLNFNPTGEFAGSGELGVTGIVVDPATGDVFASMVYDSLGQKYGKVMRFHSTDGGRTAATQTTILSGIPSAVSHQVQALTIGPDGKLYLNTGDGSYPSAAPDVNDLRGKILRMNLDGSMPPDNPFAGTYVYAKGFRNPFGAAWRSDDGFLYISDNGQKTDDRLVKVFPGEDYGWRLQNPDLTVGAIFLWTPTVSPVEMDFCPQGVFGPDYTGDLFVGWSGIPYISGRNPVGKKIQRFKLDADGNVISNEIFVDYVGSGRATVVGVEFGPDGLYFTDLFGENGFDYKGRVHGNVYRVRWTSGDTIAPEVQNVKVVEVSDSTASLTWETSEPARTLVEYGPAPNLGNWTALESEFQTSHRADLSALADGTEYLFRIWAWDAANNSAISDTFSFTTKFDSSYVRFDSLFEAESLPRLGAVAVAPGDTTVIIGDGGEVRLQLTAPRDSLYWFILRGRGAGGLRLHVDGSAADSFAVQIDEFGRFGLPLHLARGRRQLAVAGWAGGRDSAAVELDWIRLHSVASEPDSTPPSVLELRVIDTTKTAAVLAWRTDELTRTSVTLGGDTLFTLTTADSVFRTAYRISANGLRPATDYFAVVTAVDVSGNSAHSDTLHLRTAGTPSSVSDSEAKTPRQFRLSQNFPNPFNPATRFRLELPESGELRLAIYDLRGREIWSLHETRTAPGTREVLWDGRDSWNRAVSSGMYLLRAVFRTRSGRRYVQTRRLLLMR